MYLGMDGTGVPVRQEENEGRAGKQPDGSAKTREVKLVTLWTAESLDKQGQPTRDPGSVSYSAAIESAATRDTAPKLSARRGHATRSLASLCRSRRGESVPTRFQQGFPGEAPTTAARGAPSEREALWLSKACAT